MRQGGLWFEGRGNSKTRPSLNQLTYPKVPMSNTLKSTNIVSLQSALIIKGQRAWTTIKASAEEQRVLWLEVGVALMYGKIKENREKGQKFSEWVQEMFPGLGGDDTAAAIWYASEFSSTQLEIPEGMSSPQNIRRWFNAQGVVPAPTPELTLETPDRLVASIEQVGKVAKKHPHTLFA